MSAAPKIIEGPWEEVVKHADEFHGRHVKVIVGDAYTISRGHSAFDTSPAAIEARIKRLYEWAKNNSVQVAGPVDVSRDSIYEDRLKL